MEHAVEVVAVPTDVSDEASVTALADRTMAEYGRVDLVCNNAGVVPPAAPLWEQEARTWQLMIGVKVLGIVRCQGVRSAAHRPGHGPLPQHRLLRRTRPAARPHALHRHHARRDRPDRDARCRAEARRARRGSDGALPRPRRHTPRPELRRTGRDPASSSMRDLPTRQGILSSGRSPRRRSPPSSGHLHAAPGTGVGTRARARIDTLLGNLADC
ncbi:SDR family oxidoreductase [Streptomyces acidiscabies]|nr:SDR family oxidoreductase [Streptomyces acidiscabies]